MWLVFLSFVSMTSALAHQQRLHHDLRKHLHQHQDRRASPDSVPGEAGASLRAACSVGGDAVVHAGADEARRGVAGVE